MIIDNVSNLESIEFKGSKVKNTTMKALVSPKQGWEGYVMREVEVKENGFTPKHSHPWPHINYIIEGKGEILLNGKMNPVTAGSFAYIPSNELHQFKNTGDNIFKFICIVPEEGHKY